MSRRTGSAASDPVRRKGALKPRKTISCTRRNPMMGSPAQMTAPGGRGQAITELVRAFRHRSRHRHRSDPSKCWSWSCRRSNRPTKSWGCWNRSTRLTRSTRPSHHPSHHPSLHRPSCWSRPLLLRRSAWSAPGRHRHQPPAPECSTTPCGTFSVVSLMLSVLFRFLLPLSGKPLEFPWRTVLMHGSATSIN